MSVSIGTERAMARTVLGFLHEQDTSIVDSLWVYLDPNHVDFWLLTRPVPPERAHLLLKANDVLDREFPDTDSAVYVVNPTTFADPSFRFQPPEGAEQLRLR
jgi:hypothetical protein